MYTQIQRVALFSICNMHLSKCKSSEDKLLSKILKELLYVFAWNA